MASNVNMIDPNKIITKNNNNINPIAQYQDMFIFAELKAKTKERTVIISAGENNISESIYNIGMSERVNFMGSDQTEGMDIDGKTVNNPNYLKFTTNYYDGSTGNNIQYESFGITSIKVTINSSFIPQVNIQFVDLRGLSFFNQDNSPYRILFDFPPPTFELSIKGYYGKALRYQLHLVKYTSEFQSESGNFVIDANFVAVTYAPLTDILLRYIINSPLMETPIELNPSTKAPPRNTNELILKLKNLYTAVTDEVKTDSDSTEFDNTIRSINERNDTLNMLNNYKTDPNIEKLGNCYLISKKNAEPSYLSLNPVGNDAFHEEITVLKVVSDYDTKIFDLETESIPTPINNRLFLVFPGEYNLGNPLTQNPFKTTNEENALTAFRDKLINNTKNIFGTSKEEIRASLSIGGFENYYIVSENRKDPNVTTKYISLDVTEYYVQIFKDIQNLNKKKINLANTLVIKINNLIFEKLGMMPTIYNVFEIICKDVDKFFKQLYDVSLSAENHHNDATNFNIIAGNKKEYVDNRNKIYAFPLIVNQESVICGGQKEERIAPIKLSQRTTTPFPEMDFVYNFINTFFTQKNLEYQSNMRENQTDDGIYEWLPISPFDSKLGTDDMKSPYYNITQGTNLSPDNMLTQILKIILDRFYVLSQNAIPDSFYKITNKNRADAENAYIELYATAEAVNLVSSASNKKYSSNLKTFAATYKDDIEAFYIYLEKYLPDYYNFNETDKTVIQITNDSSSKAYTDKNNSDFTGVVMFGGSVVSQQINEKSGTPLDTFKTEVKKGKWYDRILKGQPKEIFYDFTQENVMRLRDIVTNRKGNEKDDGNSTDTQGVLIKTRFLYDYTYILFPQKYEDISSISYSKYEIQNLLNNGNSSFHTIGGGAKTNLTKYESIVDVWTEQLSKKIFTDDGRKDFDDLIYNEIINNSSKLSALFLLSNFGYALGPFNLTPNNLNNFVFTTPAAIEVPEFLPLYIGALIDAKENDTPWYQSIFNFFTGGTGKDFYDRGVLILADYSDFNKYLSENDKEHFRKKFDTFWSYGDTTGEYGQLLTSVQELYVAAKNSTEKTKKKAYEKLLNQKEGGNSYYDGVLKPLITRTNMIIFSELTFKMSDTYNTGYKSIKTLNDDISNWGINKRVNNNFFQVFLSNLWSKIDIKEKDIIKKEEEDKKLSGDEDVVTQTYYSFKNINDKWLTNLPKKSNRGYPFNKGDRKLIDSFVFVDRAMNPVGSTILNAEILTDLFNDPNITVFTALSQLLSLNGFEFFPLQNFMINDGSWEDSFKLDTSGVIDDRAAFVCMYIGGSSSYPTNVSNGFVDDGIIDIENTDAKDFSTSKENCPPDYERDRQEENNEDDNFFPYRNVRAFKVRFGEQNQSMFTSIKIDSKEYPETNESIQILSRLAGDNKEHAIPKGQNLYNLYENRSYKATIYGLGNAMIQPTQYFQLENVPLYNGAYIILSVEHDITANKMMTSFSGTKIMKYPVPRVTSPLAFMGYEGGESLLTSIKGASAGQITQAGGAVTMSQARLDELKSVFGYDVSYAQAGFNWKAAVANPTQDFPKPQFAFIKVSQGNYIKDSQSVYHATNAKANGFKIGYYHFGVTYTSTANIVSSAKEQAKYFLDTIAENNLPTPDFPLILDFEDNPARNEYWTFNKTNNNLWIQTFIDELKKAGHKTILYGGNDFLNKRTSGNFGGIPLWHPQYKENPDMSGNDPLIAQAWRKDDKKEGWAVWQFSTSNDKLDINAMKKRFFDNPKA